MQYNYLGKSDLKVSAIGFGAMSLPLGHPQEIDLLLGFAVDHGVNFIDTADLYNAGMNEIALGKAIHSYRKDIILATKVGNRLRPDSSGWDWDVSATYIREAIDASLLRLQTDYIDLYQIHGGTNQDDFEEVVFTLENLISEGKIRSYGISSIRPNVFMRYCEESNVVSNMMQYSILDRRPEEYFSVFNENNVSIIARGVLAQGLLINKIAKAYLDYTAEEILLLQSQIKCISEEYGVDAVEIALSYVFSRKEISSAIMGIRTMDQLRSVIEGYRLACEQSVSLETIFLKNINYRDHL